MTITHSIFCCCFCFVYYFSFVRCTFKLIYFIMSECKTRKVLVCATGSVASIKLPELALKLLEPNSTGHKVEVRIIVTDHAKHFFSKEDLPGEVTLYEDSDEWSSWQDRGDPVLHIDLGKWADVMVIAPLDANTLAKLSQGLCDNLLTCTARAWDFKKPFVVCPAMNTRMWTHPLTEPQLDKVESWGALVIPPVEKTLMCGDTGVGAMAAVDDIVNTVINIKIRK